MGEDVSLNDRINGCLLGAAIGAELGFAACVQPQAARAKRPADIFKAELSPARGYRPAQGRMDVASATAVVVPHPSDGRPRSTLWEFMTIRSLLFSSENFNISWARLPYVTASSIVNPRSRKAFLCSAI